MSIDKEENVKKLLLSLTLLLVIVPNVSATPIYWSENGNYYDLIIPGGTNDWFSAQSDASISSWLGFSGHLATITSLAENDFLIANFGTGEDAFIGAWIGGKAPDGWLDGPENGDTFSYTNWGGIEPNNSGYAYMNIGTVGPGIGAGEWADDSGTQGYPGSYDGYNDPVIGYFVEYEGPSGVVPEPLTILLFGAGLSGAFFRRKHA